MAHLPDNMEIEVKFHIDDPDTLRRKLIDAGRIEQPRLFETNKRYDDSHDSLFRSGKLLRLRKDRSCRLTFKSKPAKEEGNSDYKVYHELEVAIGDFDTMDAILKEIGYQPVQVYEKWRETFTYSGALACLDTMPFGDFLEIEGKPENIREAAHRLGLDWKKRILHNYLAMFSLLKKKEGLPYNDLTFDNFTKQPASIVSCLTELYPDN